MTSEWLLGNTVRLTSMVVKLFFILENHKRFHYIISGVECNNRFTRILQYAEGFFRWFAENLGNAPGFHQVLTFTQFSPGFGHNQVFTKFLIIIDFWWLMLLWH